VLTRALNYFEQVVFSLRTSPQQPSCREQLKLFEMIGVSLNHMLGRAFTEVGTLIHYRFDQIIE
jgi:hypothetical protein